MKKTSTTSAKKSKAYHRKSPFSIHELLNLPYRIELMPLPKEDGGGYLASIPLLKGCQSDGGTPDEAIKNLHEAQRAWFESAQKHNDPIPIPQK